MGAFGFVVAGLPKEVREILTLLGSRQNCEEGSCMDPTRLPQSLYPVAPDSQTAGGATHR